MLGPTGPTNRFKVNYYSNYIAIDFRGGEKVSRRSSLFGPGEILPRDPDGTLVLHNELEDKPLVEEIKTAEAPPWLLPGGVGPGGRIAPVGAGAVVPHRGGALEISSPDNTGPTRRRPGRGH